MNAATVLSTAVQPEDALMLGTPKQGAIDPLRETLRKELSQLHILLLGAKADLEDVIGPIPCRAAGSELKQGLKRAVVCLDAIRASIEDG